MRSDIEAKHREIQGNKDWQQKLEALVKLTNYIYLEVGLVPMAMVALDEKTGDPHVIAHNSAFDKEFSEKLWAYLFTAQSDEDWIGKVD